MERGGAAALLGLALSGFISGCGHDDPYAEAVSDYTPIYCYRTIGDVDCYKRPLFGGGRRLVNYYGPAPDDYERPEPLPAPRLDAPPPARYPAPAPEARPLAAPPAEPAAEPDDAPTPLFRSNPSSMDEPERGEGENTANAELEAEPATAEKAALSPPQPRPGTAADKPPLVIEVEGR